MEYASTENASTYLQWYKMYENGVTQPARCIGSHAGLCRVSPLSHMWVVYGIMDGLAAGPVRQIGRMFSNISVMQEI